MGERTEAGGHAHLDEGMIHAWLDGALGADVAREVAARADACDECAARVAEARGLIAGGSRVVGALDDVPRASTPPWGTAPVTPTANGSLWRAMRVTPARAAIAATLLVALGIALTRDRVAVEQMTVASAPASAAPPRSDSLLAAAIARTMAEASPPRAVQAAPGVAVAVPEVVRPAPASADLAGSAGQVAMGKAAETAARDTAAPRPDRYEGERAALSRQSASAAASVRQCYRLAAQDGRDGPVWGVASFPLLLALDAAAGAAPARLARGSATLLAADGATLGVAGSWRMRAGDSVRVDLRRGDTAAAIVLGEGSPRRAGVALVGGRSVRITAASVACPAPGEQR